MNRYVANRMLRISIDAATYPAGYRSRRVTRKDRKALGWTVLLVCGALAYFAWRALP